MGVAGWGPMGQGEGDILWHLEKRKETEGKGCSGEILKSGHSRVMWTGEMLGSR